uniref:Kelch domain containing 7A n=1 Tax=Chelonoidis abingdonii TaxID=106734 RepID=A0A8C0H3J0_CHEAB
MLPGMHIFSQDWLSDMQLAGKLALSAGALLLLTLAYRFYKSRPSSSRIRNAEHVTEQREKAGAGRGGAEETPRGLRYRQVNSNGVRPSTSKGNQSAHLDQSLAEQEAPVAGREAGGKRNICSLVHKPDSSIDDSRGASWDVASRQSGCSVSLRHNPCRTQAGNAAELTATDRSIPDTEEEEAEDMSESLAWNQEASAGQERIQTLNATSDMGLAINQSDQRSDASYTFSSIAKIQVEENYITERQPREEKPWQSTSSTTSLRGKVYDYYVQSTSESAVGDEDRPADWGGASDLGSSFSPAHKTAEPERRFGRKESFHQIADNPELQVQMEGFGALTPAGRRSDSSNEPRVELVAGANFFKVPLSLQSDVDIHLDLGNCYDVLCMAKKQKLYSLQEAAYKVMSDNYLQVLKNPSIFGRLNARERELILLRRMKGRKYITVADVSTQEQSLRTSRLCYYDNEGDIWHPLSYMPVEAVSRGCAVCSMFNYLFVVAGCKGLGQHQKPSNRVFCYNPLTSIWQEICPLNQARPHCKLVALDGYLYAIGGECLYTVEKYDPRQDRWTFTAPLPNDTFAVAHTATACDGEIYVTGGTLRYMLLRYVSRSDSWKISITSGSKDRTTEMVTAGGFIYRFDLNRSMGISVYRCSPKAKLWYECATKRMPFPPCFQCAVVENLVYCISRQFNIRFLADHVSPRFGVKELQLFPSPRGTLLPIVLVLPDRGTVQTRV